MIRSVLETHLDHNLPINDFLPGHFIEGADLHAVSFVEIETYFNEYEIVNASRFSAIAVVLRKLTGGFESWTLFYPNQLDNTTHIAFNEPGSSLASRTRFKTLTSSTIASNRECFPGGEPPRHVLTMGIGTILESRLCLLLAFGRRKAQAVASMAEGPLTAMCPASALQMHPRTIVLLDPEAALQLKLVDYYKLAYEQKPDRLKY